jgi:hypothetical protein
MAKASVPAMLRQQVDRWARIWLAAKFSPLLELRARDPGPFNYPIEVFAEWRGRAFYLNVRYRARSRKVEDDFVVRQTRMTLTGFGRFDLAYFRHTDKWFTVYHGLTAADCFREIEENEIFWPMTWRGQQSTRSPRTVQPSAEWDRRSAERPRTCPSARSRATSARVSSSSCFDVLCR